MLYFDHNATAPLHPVARQAWMEAAENFIGNPSSPHRLGTRADDALENARERLAATLGCAAMHIVWTSGATEAANTVLHHIAAARPGAAEVWVSAIEHPCVLGGARGRLGERLRLIPVEPGGLINRDWLRAELPRRRPALVAVMAANNETGALQPWREVLDLCREWEVPFLCDAVQWLGKLPARGLGQCDFVTGSAHKFGGPRGVGFLKCPAGGSTHPLLLGGSQEDGRRAGTENVSGVLAMLAALEFREAALARAEHTERLAWRAEFEQALLADLPGSVLVGASAERLWNTVSALMPPADCRQRWVVKLDRFGCAVSTGSACASGREEPSHVLAAMGYAAGEAGRVLRFSSGWETTREDWRELLASLRRAWAAVRTGEGATLQR